MLELLPPTTRAKIEVTITGVDMDNMPEAQRVATDALRKEQVAQFNGWVCVLPFLSFLAVPIISIKFDYPDLLLFTLVAPLLVGAMQPKAWSFRKPSANARTLQLAADATMLGFVERIVFDAAMEATTDPKRAWWKEELLPALAGLAEEEARLTEIEVVVIPTKPIEAERLKLRLDLGRTTDVEAREAIERSLEVVERRLATARGTEGPAQRLAAHRELVRQTAAAAYEAARLATEEVHQPNFGPLRTNADLLACEGRALEAAVVELRAMD